MSETQSKPHWSHWVISIVLFLWNLMGSVNFLFQFDPNFVATLPEDYQAIIADRPMWATIGFGLAVIGGALGAILLMARSALAVNVFILATFGAIGTVVSDGITGGALMQIATTCVAAIYAKFVATGDEPAST